MPNLQQFEEHKNTVLLSRRHDSMLINNKNKNYLIKKYKNIITSWRLQIRLESNVFFNIIEL